jgi:hypothetical protein
MPAVGSRKYLGLREFNPAVVNRRNQSTVFANQAIEATDISPAPPSALL